MREPGQPFTEDVAGFGKVYHTAMQTDVQQMLDAEDGYWFHAHPRTKGTTGYPDAIFDKAWVKNDRYLGIAFKPGMGEDLSEERLCEWRCFDAIDTMNNLYANTGMRPKYLIADVDTYRKGPEDDIYPGHPMNYVKIDRLPGPADDWRPILRSLRNGDFWVSTGEVLIKNYAVEGTGAKRTMSADLEWTYPLEFVEVVWGDGKKVDRQIVRATDTPAHGSEEDLDSVRRDGQGLGAVRGVGLGRQRRVRAADLAEPALEGANRAMTIRPYCSRAFCTYASIAW